MNVVHLLCSTLVDVGLFERKVLTPEPYRNDLAVMRLDVEMIGVVDRSFAAIEADVAVMLGRTRLVAASMSDLIPATSTCSARLSSMLDCLNGRC